MNQVFKKIKKNKTPKIIEKGCLSFCDFPEKFNIKNLDVLKSSYHFDNLNIRHVLYYSKYIGITPEKQRLFSIIFMRQMPQYILPQGAIELDIKTNRLVLYLSGYKPIPFAQIEECQKKEKLLVN